MRGRIVTIVILYAILATGCVSKGMHTRTVADLEETREASAQTTEALDTYKQQAAADIQALIA
jgi:PBP1b-binding outer membrane lipoprotein LpoB